MWNLNRYTECADVLMCGCADVGEKINMKLGQLLQTLKNFQCVGNQECNMTDLVYHTKDVKSGSCFVAIRGFKTDGHQFVSEAIAKGATAVLLEKEMKIPKGIVKIVVQDTRDALARLASRLEGDPTLDLRLVGITGTNGKTTTAFLLEKILSSAGRKTGLVTTVSVSYADVSLPSERTTPESSDLQKTFRDMVNKGVQEGIMEVTSHALELKRVVGCHFDGAIFTNLSEDHLDFHGSLESYFASKARLFRERLVVSQKKKLWGVINWDDPYGRTLAGGLPAKVWRYSLKDGVEVYLKDSEAGWDGLKLKVGTPLGDLRLSSPLIGSFNASNILAGVTAALAMEIPMEAISLGVASFQGVPGRLEKIPNEKGFQIFVDYAHTPDALENVLKTLRALQPKRIVTVFGCGGNRDRLKRPIMGKIADQQSDVVIVTSDNPRSEDPSAIIQEILKGIQRKNDLYLIPDRREAIAKALQVAKPGDLLLIAGKGHETYQEVGNTKRPFDDREVVRELLR